jgi:hypothetical protein
MTFSIAASLVMMIGRGPLAKIISLPKKKTCQTQRKWVMSDYPLLNCITARKCENFIKLQQK